MKWTVHVRVVPRPGLLDPQGEAVAHALDMLGFDGVEQVRMGKAIELSIDADSAAAAEERARTMCDRLLANPVTETFVVRAEAP